MTDFIKLPPEARPNWMEDMDHLTAKVARVREKCLNMMKDGGRRGDYIQGKVDAAASILRALDDNQNHSSNVTESVTLKEQCPVCGNKGRVLVEIERRPMVLPDGASQTVITYESWPCETCDGEGGVKLDLGAPVFVVCPTCKGTGNKIVKRACDNCHGHKTIPIVVVGTGEVKSESCSTCGEVEYE